MTNERSKALNWSAIGVLVGIATGVLAATLSYGRSAERLDAHDAKIRDVTASVAAHQREYADVLQRLAVFQSDLGHVRVAVDKTDAKIDRLLQAAGVK